MELVYSLGGIVDMEAGPQNGLRKMAGEGMKRVLVPLAMGLYPAPNPLQSGRRQKPPAPGMEGVWKEMQALGMDMVIASAPAPQQLEWPGNPETRTRIKPRKTEAEQREEITGLVEQSLALCGRVGCRQLVVPPLPLAEPSWEKSWEANRGYYLRLAKTARAQDVMILLPNQTYNFQGHALQGMFANPHDACRAVDALNEWVGEERFGCAFHAGAASLCGQDLGAWIRTVGKRLQAVCLCESDGWGTGFLPFTHGRPGQWATDWLGLIRALRASSFDGTLVLHFGDSYRLTPLQLQAGMRMFARKTGAYLLWQIALEQTLAKYPQRVLFGAGRMCRRYLACYGEKYPPLFTCDNNPAAWGKTVQGLPIRSPEALRDLPDGCAVFLCNLYYEEVEAQLRDMGLTCPIERFNDEFLPTMSVELSEDERGVRL